MNSLIFIVMAIATVALASQTPCSGTWECSDVSSTWQSSSCVDGFCRCETELGYIGKATTTDQCRCDSSVVWSDGNAYCVDLSDAAVLKNENANNDRNVATVSAIYENIVYPNPNRILPAYLGGDLTEMRTLFTDDVRGRISPVGTVGDIVANADYWYGNPSLQFPDGNGGITGYWCKGVDFVSVVAEDNVVAVTVNVMWVDGFSSGTGSVIEYNLTQTGYFRLNQENRVYSYDVVLKNLGKLSDPLQPEGDAFNQALCFTILAPRDQGGADCGSVQSVEDGGYADFADCLSYVESLEQGSMDDVPAHTRVCLNYHASRARINPQGHCTHTGKLAFNPKCYEHSYDSFYDTVY